MDWFISDTHFGHTNIIRYCNRPFTSVGQMDKTIIDNINSLVGENDTLWHLGDWAFGRGTGEISIMRTRKQILCKDIRLVYGNHDKLIRGNKELQGLFSSCKEWFCPNIDGIELLLTHYYSGFNDFWSGLINKFYEKYKGIHLFGHCHNHSNITNGNMCVEVNDYKPISLEEIKIRFAL